MPVSRNPLTGSAITLLKLAATVLALVMVARLVDPAAMLQRLRDINPFVFAAGVGLAVLQVPVMGVRWRLIVRAVANEHDSVPPLRRFQQITYIAQFFGQVLPFVAGDSMRMLLLREAGASLRIAFKSTLLDRGVAALALFVIALPAALFSRILMQSGAFLVPVALMVTTGLLAAVLLLIFADGIYLRTARWRLVRSLAETICDLRNILVSGSFAPRIIGLCLLGHGISIVTFWLLAQGQAIPFGIFDAMAIVPLVLLVTMMPIGVGGWGFREGFVVFMLGAAGIEADRALLLSLSFGIVLLVAALPGAVMLTLSSRRLTIETAPGHGPSTALEKQ